MGKIDCARSVREIIEQHPEVRNVFDRHGLKGCGGEQGPEETLEFFARVHQVNLDELLGELEAEIAHPSKSSQIYQETLADTIYRRFFKAGIAIVLTIGGFWGAVSLAEIALHRNFLRVELLPAIHAHAHAMIFGWVGLFVMGFAYQSFPRFKQTTLWRPGLANLSFYLMLAGIGLRALAEMLQHQVAGLVLGGVAAVAEFVAVSLFVAIILKTGKQSIVPHNPYEKFIFGALFWFWVQAIVTDVFFFTTATAVGQQQLVHRIALIDGPLRDIQLFGFASMMIAGVSQRFVPLVYGLKRPRHDHQSLIFWLMNGSLVLDVVSYLLLVSTGDPVYGVALEAAYVLMFVWAVMLVRQLGIFSTPADKDRSWKFIRASYVWLLASVAMLPFFLIYGALTHQVFAHAYMGAHRHAFTVGFISMMILGVAARVVPILAGVGSEQVSSLWGPFVLLNIGCAGRVVLQLLTDFAPHAAYSLVGFTGFIEVSALAWWGIELWHTMNLAKTHRPRLLERPVFISAP